MHNILLVLYTNPPTKDASCLPFRLICKVVNYFLLLKVKFPMSGQVIFVKIYFLWRPIFWFDRLSVPVRATGICLFLLPWFDSIAQVQPGLTFLLYHPLKEQTVKNVSVGCYSAYRACPYWWFPTKSVALSLVHTCMYPLQHLQVWRQLWL